jgi:L-alanine-DL-glutamate epimerase-like enolase superfamily enzyme
MPPDRAPIDRVDVAAFRIPVTDIPESDGTLSWTATTLVTAEVRAGGVTGFGYTYGSEAVASAIAGKLAGVLEGRDAGRVGACHAAMRGALRNDGREGIAAMAVSAVDVALWDRLAKAAGLSLGLMIGQAHETVAVYGSGGFTSLPDDRLVEQAQGFVADTGAELVKIKIGRDTRRDVERLDRLHHALPHQVRLMVDANGAYARKPALAMAEHCADMGVVWFEEPVSSDDLAGLALLVERAPTPVEIAAGEYGWDPGYFRRMLAAGAVDVLQADATRCGGVTGFLAAAALAQAFEVPLSAHCAPTLHAPLTCAAANARHIEWFHDHAEIERRLFDGFPRPTGGRVGFDAGRPGLGIEFKRQDAARFAL